MGRQYGESLRGVIPRSIEHLVPWLLSDREKAGRAAASLQRRIEPHFPEVIEEVRGIAEGAALSFEATLCFRFLGEIAPSLDMGCSVVFLADSDRGPLLGRNNDIEPDAMVELQVCRTSRPANAAASIVVTYAGMLAGVGMNEYGLAVGGTSAHTASRGNAPAQSLAPMSLAFHAIFNHCRSVRDAVARLAAFATFGKSSVSLIADASGDSVAMELIPNSFPTLVPRPLGRDWQACTNAYLKSIDLIYTDGIWGSDAAYLQNSYARYGRIMHRLVETPMERTEENLRRLMAEIAAPGLCIPETGLRLHTAYTTIFDLRQRRMLLAPGHPAKAVYAEVRL